MLRVTTPPTAAEVAGPDPEMPPMIIATIIATVASAPASRADQRGREAHQPQRDAGAVEHRADQHEHRDRDQRILRDAGVDVGRHRHDALPADPDREPARKPKRHADRHGAEQHHHEGDEQERADQGV